MSVARKGQPELSPVEQSEPRHLMTMPYEIRDKILRYSVMNEIVVVTQSRDGRLRLRRLPVIIKLNQQLRKDGILAMLRHGTFALEAGMTSVRFYRYISHLVQRLPGTNAPATSELRGRLLLHTLSRNPIPCLASSINTSLLFAMSCQNLRKLSLKFECDHGFVSDSQSVFFASYADRLRSEFQLDRVFGIRRLEIVELFCHTWCDCYRSQGVGELVIWFQDGFTIRGRDVEVLKSDSLPESWVKAIANDGW